MKTRILVTGGAGYIGSHVSVSLLEAGFAIAIADNLCNSHRDTMQKIEEITGQPVPFHRLDVTDPQAVDALFNQEPFDGVMHFAGLKAVGESVHNPLAYYHNNVTGTLVLARACLAHGISRFVFSSSAAVYGNGRPPYVETMDPGVPTSPYAATKLACERILSDVAQAYPEFRVCLLRYFNPVGAHGSGLIGEEPQSAPNNLMPLLTAVAAGRVPKLTVWGDDYPTPDGTCIRDYVHVMDLAEGHRAALQYLQDPVSSVDIFNLGTGQGTSVLELLGTFQETTGQEVPWQMGPRRPGDVAVSYADVTKAHQVLRWQARRGLSRMCQDAWHYETKKND